MRTIYLVQSDQDRFPYAVPEDAHQLLLKWAAEPPDQPSTLHLPKSSFAEGRNELYRWARRLAEHGQPFDYYIFCDDDLELAFDLTEFERLLEIHRPPRAVAHDAANNHYVDEPRGRQVTALKYVDHFLMALSAEAAEALLPYSTAYDQTCWWLGCEEFCARAWDLYPFGTLKFNGLEAVNVEHRSYPTEGYEALPQNRFRPIA